MKRPKIVSSWSSESATLLIAAVNGSCRSRQFRVVACSLLFIARHHPKAAATAADDHAIACSNDTRARARAPHETFVRAYARATPSKEVNRLNIVERVAAACSLRRHARSCRCRPTRSTPRARARARARVSRLLVVVGDGGDLAASFLLRCERRIASAKTMIAR